MTFHFWKSGRSIAAAMLVAVSGAVCAQSTPPDELKTPALIPTPAAPMTGKEFSALPVSDGFAELDRDKDGAVTHSEAERNLQVAMSFERLDESRDGRLDLAEYAQLRAPLRR